MLIEKEDIKIVTGPIGPFGPMHKCHLTQEETVWGKEILAEHPERIGRTLIIGYNPIIYKYGDQPKAWCAYCKWFVSDECQEWLDSL
jgi:hypothetical protein